MASSWIALVTQPKFNVSTMLLLTDGTVLAHDSGSKNWWQLTPDSNGSYIKGTWSTRAPMHYTRLYYASAVLNDGRVFVAGGEFSDAGSDTTTAEIYDPLSDSWTEIPAPKGWTEIGDAPCTVLPDGRVLLGQINGQATGIYDPVANSWIAGPLKGDPSSEESWVLMSDNSVVAVQCTTHPGAEKYLASKNLWVTAGQTPADLVEAASIEIGAGILLPDGRAFFIGATPHTALYTSPANPADVGTWAPGPDIGTDPNGKTCGAKDAPACLMVDGHVLMTVGPVDGVSGDYLGPTYFYEFDGQNLVRVTDAPNAGALPYVGRMLLLPTGEILYSAGTQSLYAYSAPSTLNGAWRPTISVVPKQLQAFASFTLSGTQLNGLSQAVGYGDDASAATNYPLVRLKSVKGNIYYCRTFGHSTMAVATGAAIETTNFWIPASVPEGTYQLTVVANGIPSESISVWVAAFKLNIEWPLLWQWLIGNLADGPLWVIGPNGPVPVGPWGPEVRASIRNARRSLVAAIKSLQKLGLQLDTERLNIARQIKAVVDPALPDWARPASSRAGSRTVIAPKAASGVSSRPLASKIPSNRGKAASTKRRVRKVKNRRR
jgi:Kelch motif